MIVVFRNYFRNHMVNLSAFSIKHFLPDAQIVCFSLYKEDPNEYDEHTPLLDFIKEKRVQTKYVNTTGKPQDHVDSTQTAGYANHDNVLYITESYNQIYEEFKDVDDKVLILNEDQFFTTGQTLYELETVDFDLAFAEWDKPHVVWFEANGAIMCLRPARYKHCFPLEEKKTGEIIETILGRLLVIRTYIDRLYKLTTRSGLDYKGDGLYTNSSEEMKYEMLKANIITIEQLKEVWFTAKIK